MKTKFLFGLIGIFLMMNSCKKGDIPAPESEAGIVEKLFPIKTTTDENLKTIMKQALKDNDTKHFAADFVQQHGYINWAQSEKISAGQNTVVVAPFALEGSNATNGLIIALLKNQMVSFKFLYRTQLKTEPNSNLQSLLDYFDNKQFKSNKINYVSEQQVPQRLKQKFSGNILNSIKPKFRIINNNALSRTDCITYIEIVDYCYVPSGEHCDCNENSQYYQYSMTETHQYCYTTFDEWIVPEGWNNPTGGGGGSWDPQAQLANELNAILLPGHSYAFQNVNPNNSLTFNSAADFQNYLSDKDAGTNLQAEPSSIPASGNDTIVSVKVNRSLAGGERVIIKLTKDIGAQNFSVTGVTSSDYGITLGWDYIQDSYSQSTNGNEITVDVYGYERYYAAIKSFGFLYKVSMHFRIKINKTTGSIISSEKI